MEKQVLAALSIANHEIRLVVGEFFNSRLNIIKTEQLACGGMDGLRIIDPDKVIVAIRQVVESASVFIGTPINAVLLSVPSYRYKRETITLAKTIDDPQRQINLSDIQELYDQALAVNVSDDLVCVNTVCNTYRLNGIVYRKMPLDEKGDVLQAEFERLCADKMTVYTYAGLVEKAGLQIIDICLDAYASAKEMALFEQNLKNYVINLQLEANQLVLSLIYNGRLMSCQTEQVGYGTMAQAISKQYGIPYENSTNVLFKYAHLANQTVADRPVYVWNRGETTYSLTDKQLAETIAVPAKKMIDDCFELCSPILDRENVSIILSGTGADIDGLAPQLSHRFEKPVKIYCPETLGVRSPGWTVCLGMFYAYLDQSCVYKEIGSAVDDVAYRHQLQNGADGKLVEKNFTEKLRKILFADPKK